MNVFAKLQFTSKNRTSKNFMFSGIADAILSRRQLLGSGCPSGVFASLENNTKAI